MPTPTTIFANWTGVQFTPSSGSPIVISRVSNVEFDPGGQLTAYSGDGNRYPVGLFNLMNQPKATVESENVGAISSLAPGALGTFVAVLNDAKNGAGPGSGAIQYTLSNAVVQNTHAGGRHQQFARGKAVLHAFSSDGVTSPLAAVVL